MGSIPTRTVRVKATGAVANINAKDFDPQLHEDPNVQAVRLAVAREPSPPAVSRQPKKRSATASEG